MTLCRTKEGSDSERFCHSKYARINGRAADAVLDFLKGHVPTVGNGIYFCRLLTETRIGFSELSKNLASLCGKFKKIKVMLNECCYLEHSSSPSACTKLTRSVACNTSNPPSSA